MRLMKPAKHKARNVPKQAQDVWELVTLEKTTQSLSSGLLEHLKGVHLQHPSDQLQRDVLSIVAVHFHKRILSLDFGKVLLPFHVSGPQASTKLPNGRWVLKQEADLSLKCAYGRAGKSRENEKWVLREEEKSDGSLGHPDGWCLSICLSPLSYLFITGIREIESIATSMTEVLTSNKHCTHAAHEMDFSPRESTAVNVDSDELIGSPASPFVIESPVIVSPLVNLSCTGTCVPLSQRQHNREIAHSGRGHVEISVLALVLEALRRSGLTCQGSVNDINMEIGWPTNVRHVTHVTFDRFNGFLGLPVEFQMEVPRRVPSASASVFGVSAESMQCSYDQKGNSVPTILLLLQERLYDQGGLKAEGVFRINAENGQEEFVRDQINHGIVPYGIDVHCLAGLIKAWFRELPRGVLDSLSPEQVMQCNTEEQALALVKTLPPMQGALLDWGINLMADVVQEEHFNKMNAHNIAMVFAPNMTQMSDPLTALMHAVQVMNLLKTLILRTLRDREEALLDPRPAYPCTEPPTGNGHDNATKETPMGLSSRNSNIDEGPTFDKERIFLKSFDGRESIDDFESARTSEEILARELQALDFNFDAELSSDSHGLFSNGSSTVENTDDDSNGRPGDFNKLNRC
ncbi:hypothetical protein GOP47_0015566 [Adiantum capillus-veneris]|uniref:Uncharacterized protein n=1 Tax=Adiantum capillus-veneris TaxID=13818 RepID=A0A9D4ZDB5_ADICA|nr:hypothetical protein GOP47_0015566 [Adiantum capillus-veneris]